MSGTLTPTFMYKDILGFDDAVEKMGADIMRWLYVQQNPSLNVNFGYNWYFDNGISIILGSWTFSRIRW